MLQRVLINHTRAYRLGPEPMTAWELWIRPGKGRDAVR